MSIAAFVAAPPPTTAPLLPFPVSFHCKSYIYSMVEVHAPERRLGN